jgi:universal stress protein A
VRQRRYGVALQWPGNPAQELEMSGYRNVLVAIDLAADNRVIMERARSVVAPDGQLAIIHVMEPAYFYYGLTPTHQIGVPATTMGFPDDTEEELTRRATAQLEQFGDEFGVAPEQRFLERGHAATHILELSEEKGVELVVLGSHGRHGIQLLLGSTANAVLHRATCDVLAVRVYEA